MVTACLIATTDAWSNQEDQGEPQTEDTPEEFYDSLDGPSEEEAYMQGKRCDRGSEQSWIYCSQGNIDSSFCSWVCYPVGRSRRS